MTDPLRELLQNHAAPLSNEAVHFLAGLSQGAVLHYVGFQPPEDLLSTTPSNFLFEFSDPMAGMNTVRAFIPWSARLERELMTRGVRVSEPNGEALRAGTNLLGSLAYVDIRFGRSYVESVLWELINERYGYIEVMAATLQRIPHYSASRGPSYRPCRFELEHQIDGYQHTLIVELHYERNLAYRILVAGLLYLLDRRHTLSIRNVMFPGSGSF